MLAATRPADVSESWGALGLLALVDLAVGVAELDGDVALELCLVPLRLCPGQRMDKARLAVGDVANDADVERRLLLVDERTTRAIVGAVHCTVLNSKHHRVCLTLHLLVHLTLNLN